jgi:4-amino-4-deoxy-L-arabinose transferase-like glycosyltransferase
MFPSPENFTNGVLDEICIGIALIAVSVLAGNRFLRFFALQDISTLEGALFSAGIGLGLLSTSIFLLGLFQILYFESVIILLIGFCALAGSNYEYGKSLLAGLKDRSPKLPLSGSAVILVILCFASLTLLNTLTPPVSRDALIHHLAVPKWYINNHGIVDIPFSIPSYYPPFVEMLFAGALLVSSDILAKLIHFSFYVGCLLFTFVLAKRFMSTVMALMAVLLFGSLPVVFQVSSIAYADLGLAFFTLGGLVALYHWSQTRERGWFLLGALMTGWAVGCKYNGLIVLFIFLIGIISILSQWKSPFRLIMKNLAIFLLFVLAVNILWLGRNSWFAGNPGYPLANKVIGKQWLPNQPRYSQFQIRRVLHGETLWDQILLPWNISIKTESSARHELDGVINPVFLIFLPFFICLPGKPEWVKRVFYVFLLYFLFFWASSRVRLRYLMPVYPLLGIITAYTVAAWELKWKRGLGTVVLCLAFLLNLYWLLVYTATIKPLDFLSGKETRRSFLCRHIPSYPIFEFANAHLPPDARVMFLYGGKYGNDGYYLERDYFYDSRYMGYTGKEIVRMVDTPQGIRKEFLSRNITHLLINWKRLQMDYASSLSPEKIRLFRDFCRDYLRLEFESGSSSLYRLL